MEEHLFSKIHFLTSFKEDKYARKKHYK